ncbi:hypothetical protein DERP_007600, partial [Dermatophagoides pteronyssinus]
LCSLKFVQHNLNQKHPTLFIRVAINFNLFLFWYIIAKNDLPNQSHV